MHSIETQFNSHRRDILLYEYLSILELCGWQRRSFIILALIGLVAVSCAAALAPTRPCARNLCSTRSSATALIGCT
jgi:hypothetical protein